MSISIAIPEPFGIKFEDWAAVVAEVFAGYGVEPPTPGEDWKGWGAQILRDPVFGFAPSPLGFDTWQEWACRLRDTPF